MTNLGWPERLIYLVVCGSRAYGTDLPDSDEDYRGVVIPPKRHLLGLQQFEQAENKDPDVVVYSLHKFARLALANNPSILELLFVPEDLVVVATAAGHELRSLRDKIVSQRAYFRYIKYAESELRKTLPPDGNTDPYAYDGKRVMHALRLLLEVKDLFTMGKLKVRRPEANLLLDVRRQKYSIDSVKRLADELFVQAEEARKQTCLPPEPDYDAVEQWLIETSVAALDWKGHLASVTTWKSITGT